MRIRDLDSQGETKRSRLYIKARKALGSKCEARIKKIYEDCIKSCEDSARVGIFEASIPKELLDIFNNSTTDENKTIIEGVKDMLETDDLYITDERQGTFDSPVYKIKFNTPSQKDCEN